MRNRSVVFSAACALVAAGAFGCASGPDVRPARIGERRVLIKTVTSARKIPLSADRVIYEIFHPNNDPVSAKVSLACSVVRPGGKSEPHRLSFVEIQYVLQGRGVLTIDGTPHRVQQGQAIYIPAGSTQQVVNDGQVDLRVLAIVAPAFDPKGVTRAVP